MPRPVLEDDMSPLARWAVRIGLLGLALALARLVLATQSWSDFGFEVLAAIFAVGFFWLVGSALQAGLRRRAAAIKTQVGASQVWPVQSKLGTYYLALGTGSLDLVTRRAGSCGSWPLDQVRQVIVERVPVGTPSRTGMRIELGKHRTHESVIVVFPRWGGIWSSDKDARSAKAIIEAARSTEAPR